MKSRVTRAASIAALTLLCAAPLTSHAGALADLFSWFRARQAPAAPAPAKTKSPLPAPAPSDPGPGGCNPTGGC
jgi:hypothetical protein